MREELGQMIDQKIEATFTARTSRPGVSVKVRTGTSVTKTSQHVSHPYLRERKIQ